MAKETISDKRINEKVPMSTLVKMVREAMQNKKIGKVAR